MSDPKAVLSAQDSPLQHIRIVMVNTFHPGNIGAVARAMKNMGVYELVLVEPLEFPHDEATSRAAGAVDILENARVVATVEERWKAVVWLPLLARAAAVLPGPCSLHARRCSRLILKPVTVPR